MSSPIAVKGGHPFCRLIDSRAVGWPGNVEGPIYSCGYLTYLLCHRIDRDMNCRISYNLIFRLSALLRQTPNSQCQHGVGLLVEQSMPYSWKGKGLVE